MKTMRLSYFIFFLILFIACGQERGNNVVTYHTSESSSFIVINNFEAIASEQIIRCEFSFVNATESELQIAESDFALQVNEGSRTTPTQIELSTRILKPLDTALIRAVFYPVHDRRLFHYTNLRGDIQTSYHLIFSDASGASAATQVIADSEELQASVKDHGLGTLKILVPDQFIGGTFSQASNEMVGTSSQITDNEILHKGFWMKIFSYHHNDTLTVRCRFVNQSDRELTIGTPSIINGSHQISAVKNIVVEKLIRGSRAEVEWKYALSNVENVILDLSSFKEATGSDQIFISHQLRLKPL